MRMGPGCACRGRGELLMLRRRDWGVPTHLSPYSRSPRSPSKSFVNNLLLVLPLILCHEFSSERDNSALRSAQGRAGCCLIASCPVGLEGATFLTSRPPSPQRGPLCLCLTSLGLSIVLYQDPVVT